jgi:hypothetical protein
VRSGNQQYQRQQAQQLQQVPSSKAPVNYNQLRQQKKEVNLLNLLDDSAIQRTPNTVNQFPEFSSQSEFKQERWQSGGGQLDPANNRAPVQNQMPDWSEHVQRRKNAWENKTRQVDNYVAQPAYTKVPSDRPPFWAKNSAQTHNTWQTASNRGILRQPNNHNTDYVQDSSGPIPVNEQQ